MSKSVEILTRICYNRGVIRFDDLVSLLDTACEEDAIAVIREQLQADLASKGEISLLAKWLPSVNASNRDTVRAAKKIARSLGMTDAVYRKTLVALRRKIRLLENNLREKDYTFAYERQPSKAMFKYRKAFWRNDRERYAAFLEQVNRGEATLHADTIAPYELVAPYLTGGWSHQSESFLRPLSEEEKATLNTIWASLPAFGNEENALAVVDTSGSMYWDAEPMPAAVALSLGLYFAEHNTGVFQNHFIEFSTRPQLIEIQGDTFADRLRFVTSFCEVADTNLEAVFQLILQAAVKNRLPQSDLPERLYIITDMEFNRCVHNAGLTNFENAKAQFAAHGYTLPQVVFWNVSSRNRQQPVAVNEQGVALVSGCTPRLFSLVMSGELSPYTVMRQVLDSPRYAPISA